MKQQGKLQICAATKSVSVPKTDFDGNIYGYEFDVVPCGFTVKTNNLSPDDISALKIATLPAERSAIHKILEHLAQIKPIGRSDVKQSVRISYLVYDLFQEKISEYVLNEISAEYRKNQTQKFFPDHADFLKTAKQRMIAYNLALEDALNPRPPEPQISHERIISSIQPTPEPKWQNTKFKDWDNETKNDFVEKFKDFDASNILPLLRVVGWNYDDFKSCADKTR